MSLLYDASLIITPNAYKESKLYALKPQSGLGDMTVTRATTATRVNSEGFIEVVPYNLLQYSEQFDNAAWSVNNATVTVNTTTAPNGTLTADTITNVSGSLIGQSLTFSTGQTFTFSVYLKRISGTGIINIIDVNGNLVPVLVTNDWQRFSITSTNTSTTVRAYFRVMTTGDSIAAWGAQLVQGSTPKDYFPTTNRLNVPRIDYSNGGCPSILVEPQRTNVLLNTIFSGSGATPTSWTQPVATGTSVLTTSTLGTGAQACSQSATLQRPFLSQSFTLVANTTYSYSIYVESISGSLTNENVLLASGFTFGATVTYFSNGVSVSPTATAVVGRLSIVIVVSVLGGSAAFRCGIGTSSNQTGTLLFSRPQLEAGAYQTSYIPTSSASVTRNQDQISRNNVFTNGLITAAGGTWFVSLKNNIPLIRDDGSYSLFISDAPTSPVNGFTIRSISPTIQRLRITKRDSFGETSLYPTTTDTVKIAIKWNGATADVFVNGVKVVNGTTFTTTNMEFLVANGIDVPKYINSMALYKTPLTDTECISLTTL
jgi:hypothetical protein